jgi:hypothetical protein
MFVLQALADTAARQRRGEEDRSPWWRLLLPVEAIAAVEAAAGAWLAALYGAGVVFPTPAELVECLQPMEGIAEPAPVARVH